MIKTLHLKSGTTSSKREELRNYFLETLHLEESLFSLLNQEESFLQKPDSLRHPLIFYYGHTATFYINKLFVGNFISERINAHFESMFAVGVDEMSWDDLNEINYHWPTLAELKDYRKQVTELVLKYISTVDFKLPLDWESALWPILMGIEHQRIHLETSSVLIRQLDLRWIEPQKAWAPCTEAGPTPQNQLLIVDGGPVDLGKKYDADSYGWDNEYGTHSSFLNSFKASQFLVSNGEFLEFVLDQGYQNKNYWSEEGHHWKVFRKAQHPLFWISLSSNQSQSSDEFISNKYKLRTLEREIPLPLNWPVEVNYLEAQAFCQWKSKKLGVTLRLPTEDEWSQLYKTEEISHPWKWTETPFNIHLDHFKSSCPVDKFKSNNFYDVVGNVWQWTETPIYAFDGFKVHPLYDDFSVPTFDGKHNLIKGGSWISTGNEALPESRYAFRRHFFQHAGFRYVESNNTTEIQQNPYETETLLAQYCEFHYGDEYFGVPNYPKACIDSIQKYLPLLSKKEKALDLGCAVGRSSLELSKYFNHVIGLDFSARFIDKAQSFIHSGRLRYTRILEGELVDFCERRLEDLDIPSNKIEFFQADACNLPEKFSDFDLIFAGNLIDRLYAPQIFLSEIHKHLAPGGLLVLTSPYTWLEEYTPKKDWLGGLKKSAENFTTLDGLKQALHSEFKLVDTPADIPFVIRETQRKFQHSLAQMTVWQKI
ncbi:MAG TPA: 5-histidylcysteine sulfoxide synthase [Pseudobdellovibrionaceae bacterium]|nr:5-histidylcysteine sulfoxide synthase [Pseudobdellovibrionaceae bacterium]